MNSQESKFFTANKQESKETELSNKQAEKDEKRQAIIESNKILSSAIEENFLKSLNEMKEKLRKAGYSEEELGEVLQKIKLKTQTALFKKLQKVLNEPRSVVSSEPKQP